MSNLVLSPQISIWFWGAYAPRETVLILANFEASIYAVVLILTGRKLSTKKA